MLGLHTVLGILVVRNDLSIVYHPQCCLRIYLVRPPRMRLCRNLTLRGWDPVVVRPTVRRKPASSASPELNLSGEKRGGHLQKSACEVPSRRAHGLGVAWRHISPSHHVELRHGSRTRLSQSKKSCDSRMHTAFRLLLMARYRVIVMFNVENHEALRSGQLPNVVWAHEGSCPRCEARLD